MLIGGPIVLNNGATLVCTSHGGTLSGVTLDGTLDLATNSSHVTITNGLTLDGTIDLGNASGSTSGQLNFVGAQALGGTGSIVFGGGGGNAINTAAQRRLRHADYRFGHHDRRQARHNRLQQQRQ